MKSCPVLLVSGAALAPTLVAAEPLRSTPPEDDGQDTQQADRDIREPPPTAEELLRALRRGRPSGNVIEPEGASDRPSIGPERPLLPEGASVVRWTGRLRRESEWWRLDTDSSETQQSVKLLPNTTLELMVRTVSGADSTVRMAVSGEVTVFRHENYLLARHVERVTSDAGVPPAPGPDSTKTDPERDSDGSGRVDPLASESIDRNTERGTASAEDVLSKLRAVKPTPTSVGPAEPDDIVQRRAESMASESLLPDGTPLVHRPGRLIRHGSWWTFAFESDHPDHAEPPMRLLPNQSLELMVEALERGASGLVFVVSGEVTMFEGCNYLLARVALRRIDTGNVTK